MERYVEGGGGCGRQRSPPHTHTPNKKNKNQQQQQKTTKRKKKKKQKKKKKERKKVGGGKKKREKNGGKGTAGVKESVRIGSCCKSSTLKTLADSTRPKLSARLSVTTILPCCARLAQAETADYGKSQAPTGVPGMVLGGRSSYHHPSSLPLAPSPDHVNHWKEGGRVSVED